MTLTRDFLLSKHEVTQEEWRAVMEWNMEVTEGLPMRDITWYDCLSYCNKRSAAEGMDSVYTMAGRIYAGGSLRHIIGASRVTCSWSKVGYRLPTEAEWEYACRAGASTAFNNGGFPGSECSSDAPMLGLVGHYRANAWTGPQRVGTKAANAWGLLDMHGNVCEWCWDAYAPYPDSVVTDPIGPPTEANHVYRGGCWFDHAGACRAAARFRYVTGELTTYIGLRVARRIP